MAANLAMRMWVCAAATALAVVDSRADEGGVGFWLPGQMGSLSAVPSEPGWSVPAVYVHSSVDADASKAFPRGGRLAAGVSATADLVLLVPTYVFATPLSGAQASVGVGVGGGHQKVNADAILTGPNGSVRSGSETDTLDGFADLYPSAQLKWNRGVHNTMVYAMGGVPVGAYEAGRLANLGLNHWSIDLGGGYTYLDMKTGREFSAVLGATYNWKNSDTQYKNGVDSHLDWAASQFVSEQLHVGVVGYSYYQLSGDSGMGATLGDFKSRVNGIGPQAGYFFKMGEQKGYANVKGFWEFGETNRPAGWSVWLSVAIPLFGK